VNSPSASQGAGQGGRHRPGRDRPGQPAGRAGDLDVPRLRGRLLTDHGCASDSNRRRLLADATLPARRARAARGPGPYPALTRSFPTSSAICSPSTRARRNTSYGPRNCGRTTPSPAQPEAPADHAELRKVPRRPPPAASSPAGEPLPAAKRERDLLDFGDQIPSPRRCPHPPEVATSCATSPGGAPRRVPGHLGRPAHPPAGLFAAHGHPVTAVGDPCQASTAGAARPSPTSTTSRSTSRTPTPPRARRREREPPQRGRLLDLANASRNPCVPCTRRGGPPPGPRRRARRHGPLALLPTHAEEIDWIADSLAHLVRPGKRPARSPSCAVRNRLRRIQGALVARDIPARWSPLGAAAPAESPTSSPSAKSSRTLRQRLPGPPADRPALAHRPRDLASCEGISRKCRGRRRITSTGRPPRRPREPASGSSSPTRAWPREPGPPPQEGESRGPMRQRGPAAGGPGSLAPGSWRTCRRRRGRRPRQVQQPREADHLDRDVAGDEAPWISAKSVPYGTGRRSRRALSRSVRDGRGVCDQSISSAWWQQCAATMPSRSRRGRRGLHAGAWHAGVREAVGESRSGRRCGVLAQRLAGGEAAVGVREVLREVVELATDAPRQP